MLREKLKFEYLPLHTNADCTRNGNNESLIYFDSPILVFRFLYIKLRTGRNEKVRIGLRLLLTKSIVSPSEPPGFTTFQCDTIKVSPTKVNPTQETTIKVTSR